MWLQITFFKAYISQNCDWITRSRQELKYLTPDTFYHPLDLIMTALLLKHVGYNKVVFGVFEYHFHLSIFTLTSTECFWIFKTNRAQHRLTIWLILYRFAWNRGHPRGIGVGILWRIPWIWKWLSWTKWALYIGVWLKWKLLLWCSCSWRKCIEFISLWRCIVTVRIRKDRRQRGLCSCGCQWMFCWPLPKCWCNWCCRRVKPRRNICRRYGCRLCWWR